MQFNWNDIRSLNGSQDKGFEELCAQLARSESPDGVSFVRKGAPDAGVECYWILQDGNEWGWQAKYFHTMGTSQWSQLDKSVKTALDKHPELVRYFVCIPLDLPDARKEKQKSAMQRWNERVEKWEGWAQKRDMCVEFIWWGSSELIEHLSQNEHIGRRYFWFGQRGFDNKWFQERLKEAGKAAGPRYTPKIHVDLPIAQKLERFSRSKSIFNEIKSLAKGIRSKFQTLARPGTSEEDPSWTVSIKLLADLIDEVLKEIAKIEPEPIGRLPLADIANKIAYVKKEVDKIEETLSLQTQPLRVTEEGLPIWREDVDKFKKRLLYIYQLQSELEKAYSSFEQADSIASGHLMLLKGKAGTGKTHLLCDFTNRRIALNAPTVLLMGQRFVTNDSPWTQILQQLDLPGVSVEEFVGALEAAAQTAGCRALLIIDALNEGQGPSIWPDNLAAFLSALEKSPWIGVLLSIRSTYEDVVIPEEIRKRAVSVTHDGFTNYEYDAARTFFSYYGLEFPSTPILQPEFQNPLLLKTLCLGLKDRGERRLPRGFHGITSTLDLYLETVNKRLSGSLDFDPKDQLVRKALEKIATQMVKTDDRWLPRSKAKKIVNQELPDRKFSRSLYHGMVIEGVLIEEMMTWKSKDSREDVVFISYDRFTDHIIADSLLRTHLDTEDPEAAFSEGGDLSFICEKERDVPSGLIEALCIQVPELTGEELVTLAPKLLGRWDIDEAFRQSMVWRKPDAVSESTRKVLNKLIKTQEDWDATLDVLLTVATLEGHPFNAGLLHWMLQQDSMPDRDAWWSTYLHRAWAWDDSGAVRRIVDWAWGVAEDTNLKEKTVDLCSIALAWMFTTSNRYLRDRATKALVSLLTGRLDSAIRLVDRFSDVDDPYVAERIYAVAYGVAMRSHDAIGVEKLSSLVYERIFANGTPPVHILLRDYARGVIERAIYLGSNLEIDECLIRPPYKSVWPKIPDEKEIQPLMSDPDEDADISEWAKTDIVSSVMEFGDFARYVIGTNFHNSSWLSLRLDEDPWRSIEAQEEALSLKLSDAERLAWEEYKNAEIEFEIPRKIRLIREESRQAEDQNTPFEEDRIPITDPETGEFIRWGYPIPRQNYELPENDPETEQAEQRFESAQQTLRSKLTPDHLVEFDKILKAKSEDRGKRPSHFDLSLIQRYVLWRVFHLGWTTERFGEFDRSVAERSYRQGESKAERIGKKYQWIAYHEILAYIADHYQYRESSGEDENDLYQGPWQESLRNIDPSCLLLSTPGGTSWDSHSPSWWAPVHYENWDEDLPHWDWIEREDDIPDVRDLLIVKHSSDGTHWLNVDGFFNWRQSHPPDVESYDVEQRDFWLDLTGYFIRAKDADIFIDWAKDVDFWGLWMPESPKMYGIFLGEYRWSPAFRHVHPSSYGRNDWVNPNQNCPVSIRPATFNYNASAPGFDCSLDDSYTMYLPHPEFVNRLELKWSGKGSDYLDPKGRRVAFDPTAHKDGPTSLLLREDLLRKYLSNEGLALCWTILGEKRVIGGSRHSYHGALRISGAYKYTDQGPKGFLNFFPDKPRNEDADSS